MDPTTALILGAAAGVASKAVEATAGGVLANVGEGLFPHLVAWRNQRVKRAEAILADASSIVRDSGVPVQTVPGRILFPLLEKASMEEDEELRKMWARLLASAAGTTSSRKVLPAFIDLLSQLSAEEARDLKWFAEQQEGYSSDELLPAYRSIPEREAWGLRLSNLERLGLIETELKLSGGDFSRMLGVIQGGLNAEGEGIVLESTAFDKMRITGIGKLFVEACEGPKAEEE